MSRDNHIEEMAKDLCPLFKEYGECNTCDAVIDIGDEPCVYRCMAEMILDKGYRKASEVARDIIEALRIAGITENRYPIIAELKKKYTESEKDNV